MRSQGHVALVLLQRTLDDVQVEPLEVERVVREVEIVMAEDGRSLEQRIVLGRRVPDEQEIGNLYLLAGAQQGQALHCILELPHVSGPGQRIQEAFGFLSKPVEVFSSPGDRPGQEAKRQRYDIFLSIAQGRNFDNADVDAVEKVAPEPSGLCPPA